MEGKDTYDNKKIEKYLIGTGNPMYLGKKQKNLISSQKWLIMGVQNYKVLLHRWMQSEIERHMSVQAMLV